MKKLYVYCLFSLLILVSCVSPFIKSYRDVASDNVVARNQITPDVNNVPADIQAAIAKDALVRGGHPHFPPNLSREEFADFWHLSEGSEVFPMKWLMLMNDQMDVLKQPTHLNEKLDEKFGVLADNLPSAYPMRWIGLTAAWSGLSSRNSVTPYNSDIKLAEGQTIEQIANTVRTMDNREISVAMVGVNCTFCHTGGVQIDGRLHVIDGAPNTVAIHDFFHNLFGSAVLTLLDEKALSQFLKASGVTQDSEKIAQDLSTQFAKELKLPNDMLSKTNKWILQKALSHKAFIKFGEPSIQPNFFKNKDVIEKYLTQLFKLSYKIPLNQNLPKELQARMAWLASAIGYDPNLKSSVDGYSRSDAFGRISNLVARGDNPVPLTVPVSVPMMWSAEYRDVFHYNGNTNSVLMRNIGQSFGLGSIEVNKETHDSTINLHNLHRIESLLYKVPVPNGSKMFKEIDISKAISGCNLYYKKCATCHEPKEQRVGPTQEMIEYNLIANSVLASNDKNVMSNFENYGKIQSTPITTPNGEVPFREALFGFTRQIRERYFSVYGVSVATENEWSNIGLRGAEVFRDTSLSQNTAQDGSAEYMNRINNSNKSYGYIARSLSGVWATGPFLHNGSVPTVYDLLQPANKRPKIFFVGSHALDTKKLGFVSDRSILTSDRFNIAQLSDTLACINYPDHCFNVSLVGNDNRGHEFSNDLNDQQRYQLIEFLKILRPEVEYSWNQPLLYELNKSAEGNAITCSLPK